MKKILIELKVFSFSLLVAISLQAQDQALEQPEKKADESAAVTNDLEKADAPAVWAEEEAPKKSRSSRRHRDRTVIGDKATVAEGDSVNDLVVIAGDAEINGQVRGDLVVILGNVTMGTNAEVRGEVVVVGGELTAPPGVRIDGDRVVIGAEHAFIPGLEGLQRPVEWLARIGMTARPFPYQYAWSWIIAGIFLLLYILASVLFPRSLERTVQILDMRPGSSFFTGLLALMLVAPLAVFLVVSVVGIVLVPVIVFGMLVAFFFGKIAVYRYAGQQIGAQLGVEFLRKPLVALIIGAVLFYGLYMLPVLGFIVWAAITPLALGAALLAFFKRFSGPKPASAPVEGQTPLPGPPPPLSTPQPVGSVAFSSYMGPRVGFWYRFMGTIIDAVIVGAILAMIEVKGPAFLFIWVAYHVGMWTWKGQTIGAMILRTKVVRLDGQPIDFASALVRAFSAFISAAVLFVGFFWAGWTKDRQSWHDRIAGTTVVKFNPVLVPAF
jgi:uncharacterized RDD family membrane protein YckC